jgi:hypothetical protein
MLSEHEAELEFGAPAFAFEPGIPRTVAVLLENVQTESASVALFCDVSSLAEHCLGDH